MASAREGSASNALCVLCPLVSPSALSPSLFRACLAVVLVCVHFCPRAPAGWGVNPTSRQARTLTFASIRLNFPAVCINRLLTRGSDPDKNFNANIEWCASVDDSTATCAGDSGAPMFTIRQLKGKPTAVVHGIMSVRTGGGGCVVSLGTVFAVLLLCAQTRGSSRVTRA